VIHPSTPSQTVGPYFAIGMPWPKGPHAVAPGTDGAFTISGMIYDGAGAPIPDYLLETWQCDPSGHFNDIWGYGGPSGLEGFRGFARAGEEDGDGSFEILTVKPGTLVMGSGAVAAPHIDVSLFARGMLHRVVTRWYFADEEEANAADPVLARVPAQRRETLLAKPLAGGGYEIDIHVQGPGETVFFDV
jgi:protocatechuate 3,4-dioxygenase alpha subunit